MAEKKQRYEVALAKAEDRCCFVTFHRCGTLAEAKSRCILKSDETGREAVVLDGEEWGDPFAFRHKSVGEKKTESVVKDDGQKKIQTKPKSKYKPANAV